MTQKARQEMQRLERPEKTHQGRRFVKTNNQRRIIAPIARQGLALAAFLAMVLSVTGVGRAQAMPPQAQPAASQALVEFEAQPAAIAAPLSASNAPQPRGNHEGIQVHGHWTIEVKDSDGKVVTHREFENSLLTAGQVVLGNLLAGSGTPGGWKIQLCHSGGMKDCQTAANPPGTVVYMAQIGTAPASSAYCTTKGLCYPTLQVSPPPAAGTQIVTLTGSVTGFPLGTAASPFNIDTVNTTTNMCISALPSTNSPSACSTNARNLVGNSFDYLFTGKSLSPPVSVGLGQSVSATVTFSFSSN
jgi:hypothetical protein